MENATTNGLGTAQAVEGVSADQAADSSPESNQTAQPDFKNLKAEMNRKISKMSTDLKQEIIDLKRLLSSKSSVEETTTVEPDMKRYVDARFQEQHKDEVRKNQESSWSQAIATFPELDENSDSFDEKFFKLADKYYGSFDLGRDSEAPLKAVKLAALEMGKVEQLAREKVIKDEARRSRIISEGASPSRESKKSKEPSLNESALKKLGINPDKLKARIKGNKDKYGEVE
jgi:hypothetical protein